MASRPRINGTLGKIKKATKVSFDPARGQYVTEEYESAGDNLKGLMSKCIRDGVAFDGVRSPNKSSVQIKHTGAFQDYGVVLLDTWQLLGNDAQKSLFDHPQLKYDLNFPVLWAKMSQFASSSTGEEDLSDYMESATDGEGGPPLFSNAQKANALQWFRLYSGGITHFAVGQYVLRHTVTIPANEGGIIGSSYSPIMGGTNAIYDTSALLTECSRTTGNYPMPNIMEYAINSIDPPSIADGYTWGWRKLPVTLTSSALNRLDINFEYWLSDWNTGKIYAS